MCERGKGGGCDTIKALSAPSPLPLLSLPRTHTLALTHTQSPTSPHLEVAVHDVRVVEVNHGLRNVQRSVQDGLVVEAVLGEEGRAGEGVPEAALVAVL